MGRQDKGAERQDETGRKDSRGHNRTKREREMPEPTNETQNTKQNNDKQQQEQEGKRQDGTGRKGQDKTKGWDSRGHNRTKRTTFRFRPTRKQTNKAKM